MATHLIKLNEIVGYMMQCVFLDGNLLDEDVLDGSLLDELPMISNLCVKDVRMMYLQISSDVMEKIIPVCTRKMINIICHNVYAAFVKATHLYIQCIRYFCEGNPCIHSGLAYTQFL